MQGGGRVNVLRAVEAMPGKSGAVSASPNNAALNLAAGTSGTVKFTVSNTTNKALTAGVQSVAYTPVTSPFQFNGIMPPYTPGGSRPMLPFTVTVPSGTNLLEVSVNWADPTRSMALRVYLWDSSGNFLNYGQTGIMSDASGTYNQGHHTETYVSSPTAGAKYVIDVAPYADMPITPSLAFMGQVQFLRSATWSWAHPRRQVSLAANGQPLFRPPCPFPAIRPPARTSACCR